ncbi:hypothetical protein [Beduini massiliensis]|uniref:hypothetical protein n=1 Tax=Beduini massiliensis TaxID=1585974 RepID=UPI00059AB297|nr:hypothetical protein [Beduini massiliensis]
MNPLSKENIKCNLKDAGCENQTIETFLEYRKNESLQKQILFLKCQRCGLLEELHQVQKKIDCLDYLIYMLKQEDEHNEK